MLPERRPLTFADYRSWDDDQRWEVIAGEAYAMSSPSSLHQLVSMALTARLLQILAGSPCRLLAAPMDLKLSEHDVVQPDLLVVCDPQQIRPTHIEGPPRLVVEIVSPSTQRHDRLRKLSLYAHSGVAEYWLVTPHPFLVEVLRNVNGSFSIAQVCNEHDTLKSPAFPDLSLDLAELFAQLPPQPPIEEVRESTPPYTSV
ncbi:MAG: Uma2 family endonuclease [Vulcanimicrobiota bacterium]